MATVAEQLALLYGGKGQALTAADTDYWTKYEQQNGAGSAAKAVQYEFNKNNTPATPAAQTQVPKSTWDVAQRQIYSDRGQSMSTADDAFWDDFFNKNGYNHTIEAMQNSFTDDRTRDHKLAYENAKNTGGASMWTQLGIDPAIAAQYGLTDQYGSAIDEIYNSLDKSALVPGNAYGSSYLKPLMTDAVSGAQTKYIDDMYQNFTKSYGPNYATNNIGDDWDDVFIDDYLGKQKTDALSTIDAAKNRGQLNDVGYAKALEELNQQGIKGKSLMQSIGTGVLGGYRNNVNTYLANQQSQIGASKLGKGPDLTGISGQLTKMLGDYKGRVEGDLLSGVGETSYFDPLSIIKKGGSMQGMTNAPTTGVQADLLGSFSEEELRKKNGLTSTGNKAF